jgi:hypothetical protein
VGGELRASGRRSGDRLSAAVAAASASASDSRAGGDGGGELDDVADDGLCGSEDEVCATTGHWLAAAVHIIRSESALWMMDE